MADYWNFLADLYLQDSWIEVSSQPSSSSVSSATNDDVITTGLRVPQARTPDSPADALRRRRALLNQPMRLYVRERASGASSQEEYEESESESDRVMTSSNEALPPRPLAHRAPSATSADEEEADEDESVTAVGSGSQDVFTPQPNAFSHPPSSLPTRSESYFSQRPGARTPAQRHSFSARQTHNPLSAYSAAHQADHDAALRASLSTLLSCAAAARALPKSNHSPTAPAPRASSRIEPGTLRMVPESAMMGAPRRSSSTSSEEKRKRKSTSRSSSRERAKAQKRERLTTATLDESQVSPTLMTWVVSAGVLVLVSALTFSAGYTLGRDAGYIDAGGVMGARDSCGQDAARGLRRLRWSSAANIAVGVAS